MSPYPTLPRGGILDTRQEQIALLPSAGRAGGRRCLIRAENDIEAARAFLNRFQDSPNTYLAYEKEIERCVMWCALVAQKGLRELDCEDINALFKFYESPPPSWVANNRARRHAPDWRPFRGPLSSAALKHSRLVLRSFFDFLLEARYIDGNPVALVRTVGPRAAQRSRPRRSQLTAAAIECCRAVLAGWMAEEDPARGLRARFIFDIYLLTAGRRMELAQTSVGDLVEERGRWWLYTIGKGHKQADLPVPPTVMISLAALRTHHGLPPYPTPGEQRPMFARIHDLETAISGNMVYREIRMLFREAANKAAELGESSAAEQLRRASTHWMRHTSIGRVVEATKSLPLGQALGRHASVTTTAEYARFERDDLHDQLTEVVERELAERG